MVVPPTGKCAVWASCRRARNPRATTVRPGLADNLWMGCHMVPLRVLLDAQFDQCQVVSAQQNTFCRFTGKVRSWAVWATWAMKDRRALTNGSMVLMGHVFTLSYISVLRVMSGQCTIYNICIIYIYTHIHAILCMWMTTSRTSIMRWPAYKWCKEKIKALLNLFCFFKTVRSSFAQVSTSSISMLRQKHSNSFNRGICDLRRLPNRSPWVDD